MTRADELTKKVAELSPLARTLLNSANQKLGAQLGSRGMIASSVAGVLGHPSIIKMDVHAQTLPPADTSQNPERVESVWTLIQRHVTRRPQPSAHDIVSLLNNALGAVLWRIQHLTAAQMAAPQIYWPQMPDPLRSTISLRPGAEKPQELATGGFHYRIGNLEVSGFIRVVVAQPNVTLEVQFAHLDWSNPEAQAQFERVRPGEQLDEVVVDGLSRNLARLGLMLGWTKEKGVDIAKMRCDHLVAEAIAHAWQTADESSREATKATGELKGLRKQLRDALSRETQATAQLRAAKTRVQKLEEDLTKAGRHANAIERQLATAREQAASAPSNGDAAWKAQIDQLRKERDDLAARNDALRQDVHALQLRLVSAEAPGVLSVEPAQSRVDPIDYAQLPAWVEENFKGRLVLTRKAAKAVVGSIYHDPAVVFAALRAMGDLLHPVLAGERSGELSTYLDALTKTCCEDSAVGEATIDSRYAAEYQIHHGGRAQTLDRHVKRGATFDPRTCMRIYYTWDAQKKVIVVGHLTEHLTNRQT